MTDYSFWQNEMDHDDEHELDHVTREISPALSSSVSRAVVSALALAALVFSHQTRSDPPTTILDPVQVTAPWDMWGWVPLTWGIPDYPIEYGWDHLGYADSADIDPSFVPESCAAWRARPQNAKPLGCDEFVRPAVTTRVMCGFSGGSGSYNNQHFGSACMVQDTCYAQWGADMNSCDTAFTNNMISHCNRYLYPYYDPFFNGGGIPPWGAESPEYFSCTSHMQEMLVASTGRSMDFMFANTEAICRHWHDRRRVESDCPH